MFLNCGAVGMCRVSVCRKRKLPHCTSVADDLGTPHLCGLTLCFFEVQNRAVIVLAAALHCY